MLSILPLNKIGLGVNQTTARSAKDSTDSMPTQFSLYDYFLKLVELIVDYLYNYFRQNDMSTTTPMRIIKFYFIVYSLVYDFKLK